MMKLQNTKNRVRYQNLDLLRGILLLGVLFLHSSGSNHLRIIMTSIGECSVTGFIMLSGFLLMNSEKEYSYQDWIKKTYNKLVIPWILAIVLYLCEEAFFSLLYTGKINFLSQLKFLVTMGYPTRGWHLWFMCSFTQIYLCFPLLKKWKEKNRLTYYFSIVVWMILAMFVNFSDIHFTLTFISFIWTFIMGDIIGTFAKNIEKKIYIYVAFLLLSLNKIMIAFSTSYVYESIVPINRKIVNWLFIVMMLFLFFNIKVNINLYQYTKFFLWIYILHVFIGDFISGIEIRIGFNKIDTWWMSLFNVIIILSGCYLCCVYAEKLLNYIKTKANRLL